MAINSLQDILNLKENNAANQQSIADLQSQQSPEMIDTILGKMPRNSLQQFKEEFHNPETIREMVEWGAGAPGLKMVAKNAPLLKSGVKKGWDYLHPEKGTEEFRASIGEGTSKENINALGNEIKNLKETAEAEGKNLYQSIFKKDNIGEKSIYKTSNPSGIHEAGFERTPIKIKASGKLADKIKLFNSNPTLQNAHELQSILGSEARNIKPIDIANKKLITTYKNTQKNIRDHIKTFLNEESPELANKYENATNFWKENVVPYTKKGTIEKFGAGKSEEVTPAQLASTFTKLTPNVKKILSDLGEKGSRRILYNAIQKVQPGDAPAMAKTILDLKRTKGYDSYVTKEMEQWAMNMQKQITMGEHIKNALKVGAGASAGGLIGGPIGAIIGAGVPFAKEGTIKAKKGALKIANKLKK